jgi:hypothetical protein
MFSGSLSEEEEEEDDDSDCKSTVCGWLTGLGSLWAEDWEDEEEEDEEEAVEGLLYTADIYTGTVSILIAGWGLVVWAGIVGAGMVHSLWIRASSPSMRRWSSSLLGLHLCIGVSFR